VVAPIGFARFRDSLLSFVLSNLDLRASERLDLGVQKDGAEHEQKETRKKRPKKDIESTSIWTRHGHSRARSRTVLFADLYVAPAILHRRGNPEPGNAYIYPCNEFKSDGKSHSVWHEQSITILVTT
jgi:hypothetical protein